MRPGAKIPKLSGFPLGTTTSHSPRRVDITGEKGALRRPTRVYITVGWRGPHVVTEGLIEFGDAANAERERGSSVGIRRVEKVRNADNAPHKGKVAGEDEIARTIGRAQETFCSVKHAGTIRINSDSSGNCRGRFHPRTISTRFNDNGELPAAASVSDPLVLHSTPKSRRATSPAVTPIAIFRA